MAYATTAEWAAAQPNTTGMTPMQSKVALESWQMQRPGYANPLDYQTYDQYAMAANPRNKEFNTGTGQELQNQANFYGMTIENYQNALAGDPTKPMGQFQSVYGSQLLSPIQQVAAQTARGQGIGEMTPQTLALAQANPSVFNEAAKKYRDYFLSTYPGSLEYEGLFAGPQQFSATGVKQPTPSQANSMYVLDPTTNAIVKNPSYSPMVDQGTSRTGAATTMATAPVASRPTNIQKVFDLVVANPAITDAELASAMQTNNVTPAQIASSFGLPVAEVQARYKAAAPSVYTAQNVDKLASQILAQNTSTSWKGGLPPETAARYMADDLAKSGITDISQVSKGASGIINAMTGDKLISGYGERTKGNLWSGSYEGDGNTGFGVQFTESGSPIFYTEGASSSTLKKDLLKAAVVAAAAFGIFGPESLASIYGSGAAVGEGLTAAEAFAAGLTPTQAAAAGLTAAELTAAGYTAAELATAGVATTAATAAGATTPTGLLTGATALTATQVADLTKAGLTTAQIANLFSSGATTAAGLLQQQTSKEAADKARAMIDTETAAAKASAGFRPVGMTTRFGTSQFQTDPTTGQITSAGYTLSPEAKAAQDRFVTLAGQGITQAEQAQQQFAPLQTGAQNLFNLGNQYIAQSPEAVAQNYLNQQMSLLQPGRELELANLQNKLQQQGRGGLAVAQGGALGATTPELQALYNARATQEAQLAANAQQYGQQQVAFGAGLLGTGAQTMGQFYGGQQAAYAPYTTALGQVQNLESMAQQPLQLGANLGQTAAQAGFNVGQLGLRGAGASVELATGRAATTNPYSTLLSGVAANPAFSNLVGSAFGSTPQASLTAGFTPAQIAATEAAFPSLFG